VGIFFPRRLLPTKPLTPLSPLPLACDDAVAFALPSTLELLRAGRAVISREEAAKVALTIDS
jgi:hypothetical protein